MKKNLGMMKRTLALILALVMTLSCAPVQAFATETVPPTEAVETVPAETTAPETLAPAETVPATEESTPETIEETEPTVSETEETTVPETTEETVPETTEETVPEITVSAEETMPVFLSEAPDLWSDVDTDALSNEISVLPGQLMPETCQIAENEIYGYVANYPLKKGHILSISNTDYVFSVRKLSGGNYNTMLKQATAASFTATEDMTVGMLIRKPDKSALTAEELASVVIYDSQYGMIGVEGYAHRFTVEAEVLGGGTATTRCNIFLPESYQETGTPSRLIVMTNGYSAHLTDSVWNKNTADNVGIIRSYLNAGYAVYVVNNTAASTSGAADIGCPQLVSSYRKAYEYIQNHFNVEEKFSIHSRSFGTFAAMRLMQEIPELIKCAIMTGPRVSAKLAFDAVNKAFVAKRFGFADSTGATYEADKMSGHDPYTDVNGVQYKLPPTYWAMSKGDSTKEPLEVIEKLIAHGNDVTSVTHTGTDHTGVCTLNSEEMFSAALEFLNEHQTEEQIEEPEKENVYQGKVISILSASTSTFAGYIPVADGFNLAHRARYPQDNLLTDVNETWWMQVINELDAKLGINDSWAGSQVLNTQDTNSGDLGPDAAMASLTRIQNLGSNGTPDLILFFGGGNDMGRGVTLGSFDPATAPTEVDLTATKWDSFTDAYVAAILRLKHFYPDAEIVAMTTYPMPSYVTAAKLDKYGPVVKAICDHYGVPYLDMRGCGVTFDMLPDKIHPNAEGMDYITEAVLEFLAETVDMEAGEHVVYSVSHKVSGAKASLGHYKGVSAGAEFTETLEGENLVVTVTMGGKDITSSAYSDGKVTIPKVTGDLVITAKGIFDADGHLQQLPENICSGVNLWKALEPEKIYYTATGWGNTATNNSWSITFPVKPGDRIWATSLGAYPDNGSTANGVRVTWFDENGVLASLDRNTVYDEFAKNGYITAPEGAAALNLPMTDNQEHYAAYLLSAEHSYSGGKCTGCGKTFAGKTISILGDSISTFAGVSNDASVNATLKGGAVYYSAGTLGVHREDTWWQQTADALGMEVLVNNSWSGSCILHKRSGTVGAYVSRSEQLHNSTTGEEPDVIAVFLGTNDFSYYQSALGTADIDYDALIKDNGDGTYTYGSPKTSCEAYAIMLHKMTQRYPDAEIYCMTLLPRRNPVYSGSDVGQPTAFNGELAKIIQRYGATLVDLENCGITSDPANFDVYLGDKRVHPNAEGMDQMTEALVSAMLGKKTDLYDVTCSLNNVTANCSQTSVLHGGNLKVTLKEADGFEKMTVKVTMGGVDVTDSAYSGGVVAIDTVTGDVVISASASIDKDPENYLWEFNGTDLVSTKENQNELTKLGGSTSGGVLKKTYYQMAEAVLLRHDRPWEVQWRVKGSWSGMLLAAQRGSANNGNTYIFKTTQSNGFIGFGTCIGGTYHNYGIALHEKGVDTTALHTYRLVNHLNDDGTNMVYLYVDGEAMGAMNNYYIGGDSNQNKIVDWVNGKDFVFSYIGADNHSLNNCALDYLQVWENGTPESTKLAGKTLSILGASISTFAGTSNGGAADTTNSTIRKNVKYYPNTTIPEVTLHDTWWMQVCEDLGLRLLVNNAWSGSAILLERSGTVGAYVDRCVQLHDDTGDNAGEEPDIICIQMGFNDFSYGKATLGTADIDYASLITSNGYGTPATTMEATAIMLDKITKRYPDAEIYMFNHFKRVNQSAADTALMEALNADIETVCGRFGVKVVDLYSNLTDPAHIGDGKLHPNRLGMDVITEAVKAAILGEHPKEAAYTVSLKLEDVTADYGTDKQVLEGDTYTVTLTSADELNVTVTMGGMDITAAAYAEGVVTIAAVTGDVIITAKAVHTPRDYRWEFNGTDLACTEGSNALTKTAGTTTDGVFDKTRYTLEKAVVLSHNQPWEVIWESEGTWKNTSGSGGRLFTTTPVNADYNARYIFKSSANGLIAMGEKTTTGSHNYGIALGDHGIDANAPHTYRLENRLNADGSNMIYLHVDGQEIGPMTGYYIGTNPQNTTSDWLSGKDFTFGYMGTDTHGFTNCEVEYIQVWEDGAPETLTLRYDDHYPITGKTVEILDPGKPTSYQVGYGVADGTLDSAVVTIEGDALVATGIGTARVSIDGVVYEVTVHKAKLNIVVVMGQSNAGNHFANATSDITCPKGTAYWWGNGEGTAATAPVDYTQPSMGFHTPLLAELYAQSVAAGDPVKNVLIWHEGITSKNGKSITDWAFSATNTNGTKATVTMIENCLEYYAQHSDKYEIVGKGVYWLQGESDTGMAPGEYTQRFMAMWDDLKASGMDYLAFFRVRKGVNGYNVEHNDLDYTGSLTAQINMINSNPDMFMATTLTENWTGTKDKKHTVDIRNYITLMEEYGHQKSYNDSYGNVASVTDGVLTTTMNTLYGSNNKCHYGKFGYGLIGADAAYNMYRALHTEDAAVVMADTSGSPGSQRINKDGDIVTLDITAMTENLSFRAACGSTAGTLNVKVQSGEKDITQSVVGENLNTFGTVDTKLLGKYEDVTIVAEYTTVGGKTECVVYNVVDDSPQTSDVYIWDFEEDLRARNEKGEIVNSFDATALNGSYVIENGVLKAKGLQLQLEDEVILRKEENWSIEWKYGEITEDSSGFLLCNKVSNEIGNKAIYFSFLGKIMISDYADGKGYRNYYSDEATFASGDSFRITNRYDSQAGRSIMSLWKNGKLIIADFQNKGTINTGSGILQDMTSYPLSGDFRLNYLGCGGLNYFLVTSEIDYLKIATSVDQKPNVHLDGHLSQLPEEVCSGTNLWAVLEHDPQYYYVNKWDTHSSGKVYSVTIPVTGGDRIYATSIGASGSNGGSVDGIRVTFFDENGVLKAMLPAETYGAFSANGCLTAPEGATAVNVPMWNNSADNELYILNRPHSYEAKVTAPTCTEQGYTTHTCTVCGDSYVDSYVAAKGHTEVIDKAIAAACTTAGKTEGKHCSVCSAVIVAQKEVPAKGHTEVTDKAVSATCTTAGKTEGKHCSTCGTILVAQKKIPTLGHSYGAWTVVTNSTCTEKGAERRDCANCDHSETRDVAPKGHTEVTDKAISATCTTAGKTEGKHCSTCGTVLVAQKEVPALGHSYGAWTVTTTPYCMEKGQERRDCSNCNHSETRDIAAKGHTEVTDKAVSATCTTAGKTEGKHCSACSTVIVAQKEVPAKGHTEVTDKAVSATCTTAGKTEGKHCSTCGTILVAQKEIPALGHSYGAWTVTTAPSCTEKGTESRDCNNCDNSETRDIAAKGHTEVTDKAISATCTTAGKTEGKHCSVCNTVLVKQNEIPAKGHTWDAGKVTKEPTEQTEGVKTYTCTVCGETKTQSIPVLSHTHKYTAKVTAPTCTEQGYTTYTCCCGDSYVDNYVQANGHSYGTWTMTTKPTCTEKGTERRACNNCDAFETREIAANGHIEATDKAVAATCTTTGLTEGKHCSFCNTVLAAQKEIPAKGHSWDNGKVTKEPTEKVEGIKTFTCTACGETKMETISILSHTHKYTAKVTAPTCTAQGYTTYTCTCGDSYVDNYVDATDHNYSAWTVTTQPTCTEKGLERRDCNNCDHYETREVTANGHTEVIDKAVAATCIETGLTEGKHCSVCNIVLVAQKEVPAKGHTWDNGKVTKEPTEKEESIKTFTCTTCGETKTETIPTLEHTHKYTSKVTAPTCTEQGYTTYTCACGDSYVDNYVKATGHNYGAWTVTTKPTCTEKGQERRDCSSCDHYETREIAANGHTEATDKAVAATCTTTGLTEGKHCSSCNTVLVPQKEIPAKGHTWDNGKVTKEPTEQKEGLKTFTCTACGETKTEAIPTLEHTHKYTSKVTAPTCTAQGYTTYTCSCGDSYVDNYVKATGHSYGAWTVTTKPTCTEKGSEHRDCSNCDAFETREIAANGHTEATDKTVAATCTTTGLTEGKHCSVCNTVLVAQTKIAALGHSWDVGLVTKEPSETEEGESVFTCQTCGETKIQKLPILSHVHKYTAVVTAPTCTERGYTTYTCSCLDSYVDDYVEAIGHEAGQWQSDEKGHWRVCAVCSEILDMGIHDGANCTICGHEPPEQGHGYELGDVNHDGKINAKDATLILQKSVGVLKETAKFCEDCAEVSGDGKLNAKDSTLILQFSVGLRDSFPAQK